MLNSRGHGSLRWELPGKHSAAPTALFISGIDNPALPGWAHVWLPALRAFKWLTIADPVQAVIDDVNRLRNHPLIPRSIPIYCYVYNVTTGELVEVEGAKKAGAAIK
jgi:hypothetical protein